MTADQFPDEGEAGGLTLDGDHVYRYEGRRVAGVTEILQGVGIVDAKWFKEWHAQRGTAVHKAMELLIRGRLDWATVDERILGYVNAGAKFCRDAGIPLGSPNVLAEHLIYSRAYQYAGKIDLAAPLFSDDVGVADWKTGAKGYANLQLAAYADALQEELQQRKPIRRFAIGLNDDGTYTLTEYKDSRDYRMFQSAAAIYNAYHLPRLKEGHHERVG